jgi:hypothetical protein
MSSISELPIEIGWASQGSAAISVRHGETHVAFGNLVTNRHV